MNQKPVQSRLTSLWNLSRWGVGFLWLGYVVTLFTLTHTPLPANVAQVTSNWDKVMHLAAYFILAVLTSAVCLKTDRWTVSNSLIIPMLIIYAAFDELLQAPFGRQPDVLDWTYDLLGIGLGMFLVNLFLRLIHQTRPSPTSRHATHVHPSSPQEINSLAQ